MSPEQIADEIQHGYFTWKMIHALPDKMWYAVSKIISERICSREKAQ